MKEAQLKETVAERAADEGLLDVAYTSADSPFGPLLLAATRRGVVRSACRPRTATSCSQELAERVSPRVLEAPARLDEARRELDLYFEGAPARLRPAARLAAEQGLPPPRPARRRPHPLREDPHLHRRSRRAPATSGRCGRRAPPAARTRSRSSSPATACCAPAAGWAATAAACR